jgi:hypothetical protein
MRSLFAELSAIPRGGLPCSCRLWTDVKTWRILRRGCTRRFARRVSEGRGVGPSSGSLMTQRIAEYIEDFSPLRSLPAFAALEQDLREAIGQRGWDRR